MQPHSESNKSGRSSTLTFDKETKESSSVWLRQNSVTSTRTLGLASDGETEEAALQRLGRQRPDLFKSIWGEIGFVYSVLMSQIMAEYFVTGFTIVLPNIQKDLNISKASTTWPAASLSLVIASFLLPMGRVADIFGGYPVYVAGLAWFLIWSIIAGFAQNEIMLDICRAMQGFGPAAYLPSSLMLLGSVYRPGPRKNLVFSLYGACAPLGFYIGIFFGGITSQFTTWCWYFWIGSILVLTTAILAFFTIPSDVEERKGLGVKMDWWGTLLISSGLILVVYALTDSGSAPNGWATPYIYIAMIVGIVVLGIAVYVEGWVAKHPLLPPDMFKVKHMKPLLIALFFVYGGLGAYIIYISFYFMKIMGADSLQTVAWFAPLGVGGCIVSTTGGFIFHIIPGTALLIFSAVVGCIAPLLFALAPEGANYFAWVLTSMACSTLCIDVTWNVTNIFITTSMPLKRQGLAGALINTLLYIGFSFWLGVADVILVATEDLGLFRSYKAVFWMMVAANAVALIIFIFFIRIKKAKSELTYEEKVTLAQIEKRGPQDERSIQAILQTTI